MLNAEMENFLEPIVFTPSTPHLARWTRVNLLVLLLAVLASAGITVDVVANSANLDIKLYDSKLRSFHRFEQLVIARPNNDTKVVHNAPPPSTQIINFTSIFAKDFLHKVLDLQLVIANLTAIHDNQTVSLRDICFQPLAPVYSDCTILSILNYYQNSHQILDRVITDEWGFFVLADYLTHFLYCVQAPESARDPFDFSAPCLGTFGGPVYPWKALHGYDGINYQNATALVITFVINNYPDETVKKAEAWEHEFVVFMKNYIADNPNMTVAFFPDMA